MVCRIKKFSRHEGDYYKQPYQRYDRDGLLKKIVMNKKEMDSMPMKNSAIKVLTKRQQYIAKQSGDPNKIEASDFKKLRKKG